MKRITRELKAAIEALGLSVEFGDEYVNVQRADGVHCEFYGSRDGDIINLFATYDLGDGDTDLDFEIGGANSPEDFAHCCKRILEAEPEMVRIKATGKVGRVIERGTRKTGRPIALVQVRIDGKLEWFRESQIAQLKASVYRIVIEFDEGSDDPHDLAVILSKESLDGGDSDAIDCEVIPERWQVNDTIATLCKRHNLTISDIVEVTDFTI